MDNFVRYYLVLTIKMKSNIEILHVFFPDK